MSCKPSSTQATQQLHMNCFRAAAQQPTSYVRAASPTAHELLKSCTRTASGPSKCFRSNSRPLCKHFRALRSQTVKIDRPSKYRILPVSNGL